MNARALFLHVAITLAVAVSMCIFGMTAGLFIMVALVIIFAVCLMDLRLTRYLRFGQITPLWYQRWRGSNRVRTGPMPLTGPYR